MKKVANYKKCYVWNWRKQPSVVFTVSPGGFQNLCVCKCDEMEEGSVATCCFYLPALLMEFSPLHPGKSSLFLGIPCVAVQWLRHQSQKIPKAHFTAPDSISACAPLSSSSAHLLITCAF